MQPLATNWHRKKSSGHKITQQHVLQKKSILNNERLQRIIQKYFSLLQWTRITWKFILHLKYALNLFYSQPIIREYLIWLQTGPFTLHAKNGIWIIHGGTRKITVCSSTFYGVNSNFFCHTVKFAGMHCNFCSATMNYPNTFFACIRFVEHCFSLSIHSE